MKNQFLILIVILGLTLVPSLFLCVKGIAYFSTLEGTEVVVSYREFARDIESGLLSNTEIADRVNRIANGEEKISQGFGMLKLSLFYWVLAFIAITLLQAFLLRILVNTRNKQFQATASGVA